MRRLAHPVLTATGLLFTAIGAIGVVLPLLPTTPFLIVAAFCFSRSSPRLHGWLLGSPGLGPLLSNWERHGAIALRAKWLCTLLLLAATGYPILSGRVPASVVPWVAVVVAGVLVFVWTRPGLPPAGSGSEEVRSDPTSVAEH